MKKSIMKRLAAAALIAIIALTAAGCSGHAPGYDQTDRCTICRKSATHSSANYGYCDEHWQDAIGY